MKELFVDVDGVKTKVNMKEVTFMPTFKGSEKFIFDENEEIIGLTDDEITRLAKMVADCIDWCGCFPKPTVIATENMIRKWFANKGWFIKLMVKHPDYNGDYAIEIDRPIERTVDSYTCKDFLSKCSDYAHHFREPYVLNGHTYLWLTEEISRVNDSICHAEAILSQFPIAKEFITLQEEVRNQLFNEQKEFANLMDRGVVSYDSARGNMYDKETLDNIVKAKEIFKFIKSHLVPSIDDETANYINNKLPKFKAKEGQKTSRVVNKLCKIIGIDTITYGWFDSHWIDRPEGTQNEVSEKNAYNPLFASFGDAINPFVKDKHIFLSVHPVYGFLSSSWGVSWTSCHTPDKENKHGYGSDTGATYRGLYASGPVSYMLDPSTIVFYINGTDAEQKAKEAGEPSPRKEMRQLFHIGKQKFIQGRLYPYDQTDRNRSVAYEAYKQYRTIVQEFLATVWGVEDLWQKNLKGSDYCRRYEYTHGTHYKDYERYENVNVSLLKGMTDNDRIVIGESPICPSCGRRHSTEDNLFCYDCRNGYPEEPMSEYFTMLSMEINPPEQHQEEEPIGVYCAYHDRFEDCTEDDMHYVTNYGWVCEEAWESGDFETCGCCGNSYYVRYLDNPVFSHRNDEWFCSHECAERQRYYYVERYDDYIFEDDLEYSEINHEDLLADDDDTVYAYYSEYDTTLALNDSCFYYDGEYYADELGETDCHGDLVPHFLLVDVYQEEHDVIRMVEHEADNNPEISVIGDDYYYDSCLVTTRDGDTLPRWDTVEYNGEIYDFSDCVYVESINKIVPHEVTTYYKGKFYLLSNCIYVDNDLVPINMSELDEVA